MLRLLLGIGASRDASHRAHTYTQCRAGRVRSEHAAKRTHEGRWL